jgi:5'-nucleotidase
MTFKSVLRTGARGILALSTLLAFGGAARAGSTTITLLHVNDSHSHLDSFGPKDGELKGTLGGIAKVATIVENERSREDNVLLLHAGDSFEGDLCYNAVLAGFQVPPELSFLKALGFDAMAVGNHEFDGGPDLLYGVLWSSFSNGGVPLLSANLDLARYPALKSFISPSIVKTYGDVKVGIFGLTVPDEPATDPSPAVLRSDYVKEASRQVKALRSHGADVVILLSHLGFRKDEEVAANVAGIDFIIGGHDHYLFKTPVAVIGPGNKTTLIFQAGSHYLDVGKLTFTVADGAVHVDKYQMIPVDATIAPDPYIQEIVDAVKAEVVAGYEQDFYGEQIGYAATNMEFLPNDRSVARDTALGNLVTDAYRAATGTPIGITANGWISEKIWAGPILGADVFHAVSYGFDPSTGLGFNLLTADMTGLDLLTVLEYTLAASDANPDFFLQASGLTFQYDSRNAPGERVILSSVRVGGEPIDPSATYSVTVNEGSYALVGLLGITPTNPSDPIEPEYVAVRDYIGSLGTVAYGPEGRIQDVGRRGKKK